MLSCSAKNMTEESIGLIEKNVGTQSFDTDGAEREGSDKVEWRCRWCLTGKPRGRVLRPSVTHSGFFGPSFLETLGNMLCLLSHMFNWGLFEHPKHHQQPFSIRDTTTYTFGGDESFDYSDWLAREYLKLAGEVSEGRAEGSGGGDSEARRFVLDRLAELLERKQQVDNLVYKTAGIMQKPELKKDA